MTRQCSTQRRCGLIGRALSAQAARPHGLLGRALGRLWVTETASVNDRALALLDAVAGEHVLEIGFGPGRAIRELAARGARVTGVDPSPVMLAAARRRNTAAIEARQVHLLPGDVTALPLPDDAVDAVLAVHTLYFWPDLADGLREIRRVLAVDGRVVLAFRAAEHGLPRRFDPAVYRVPTTEHAQHTLHGAGFDEITLEIDPHGITHLTARAHASSDRRCDDQAQHDHQHEPNSTIRTAGLITGHVYQGPSAPDVGDPGPAPATVGSHLGGSRRQDHRFEQVDDVDVGHGAMRAEWPQRVSVAK